jgi:hypothetical protein
MLLLEIGLVSTNASLDPAGTVSVDDEGVVEPPAIVCAAQVSPKSNTAKASRACFRFAVTMPNRDSTMEKTRGKKLL